MSLADSPPKTPFFFSRAGDQIVMSGPDGVLPLTTMRTCCVRPSATFQTPRNAGPCDTSSRLMPARVATFSTLLRAAISALRSMVYPFLCILLIASAEMPKTVPISAMRF